MTKQFLTSKSFWGSVVTLIAMFWPKLFTIFGTDNAGLVDHIVGGLGGALAIYGRWVANMPLSFGGPSVTK